MGYLSVKDSGQRQDFDTGAVRDTQEGKGRFDLLPPDAIFRIAKHYENGARKYSSRNWEKGIPIARYMDSALRHTFAYIKGGRDEDHLAAACWNLMCALQTEEWIEQNVLPKELDDLPKRVKLAPTATTALPKYPGIVFETEPKQTTLADFVDPEVSLKIIDNLCASTPGTKLKGQDSRFWDEPAMGLCPPVYPRLDKLF